MVRDESRERFEEALTIIERAWSHDACAFEGRYFQIPSASVVPTGVGQHEAVC